MRVPRYRLRRLGGGSIDTALNSLFMVCDFIGTLLGVSAGSDEDAGSRECRYSLNTSESTLLGYRGVHERMGRWGRGRLKPARELGMLTGSDRQVGP